MPASAAKPLVSVVTAAWNGADYLREAIESALAQTYRPLEIVVVDDGSTDHTAQVCAAFGNQVRYFHQEKDDKGGATAFARGLREARGEYLAALDQDDRWMPEKIARQVAVMQAQPETGAVFTRVRKIDSAGRDLGPSDMIGPSGDVFHELLRGNRYFHSSGLYPSAVLDAVGHPDINAGIGDWDQWLRIARRYPIVMIDEELTDYRLHESNYSGDLRLMAGAILRVLENQRDRLHPGCTECRRSCDFAMAEAHLLNFHAAARSGRLSSALPSLWGALKSYPTRVLNPRHMLTVAKSLGLLVVRRRSA